ncbi:MAG: hypothetical protein IJP43_06175 [Oscillospiraceae bacterium]|nr:hypothetical protein [Clostridia bacterium]MBQ6756512.1 hypothetical protein [Oscillospiraceae bacterium]
MEFGLPTTVEIDGEPVAIRSDYRVILDILVALGNPEFSNEEKIAVVLLCFYPDYDKLKETQYEEAIKRFNVFVNGGKEESKDKKSPRLMDWEQDYDMIIAPINRTIGTEIRALEYLHWWTFLAAYNEIGDCLFSQVVRIRDKQARGKPLDKLDREFASRNANIINLKNKYTKAEDETISAWMGGVKNA